MKKILFIIVIALCSLQTKVNAQLIAYYTLVGYPNGHFDQTNNYPPAEMYWTGTPPDTLFANGACTNGSSPDGQELRTPNITGLDTTSFQMDCDFILNTSIGSRFVLQCGVTSSHLAFWVDQNGNAAVSFQQPITFNNQLIFSSYYVSPSIWHSASVKYTNNYLKVVVDGNPVISDSIGVVGFGNNFGTLDTKFQTNGHVRGFDGCLKNLKIYNHPVIITNPPSDISVNSTGNCSANVSFSPGTALSPTTVNWSYSIPSGSFFQIGTHVVIAYASNGVGTDSCTFNVTVVNIDPPQFSYCPPAITLNSLPGGCNSGIVSLFNATAADCNGNPVAVTNNAPSVFPIGTTLVTWTATSGTATATCTQNVNVLDNSIPILICPGNITVTADSGQCSKVVTFGNPTVTDCCILPTGTIQGFPNMVYIGTFQNHSYYINTTSNASVAYSQAVSAGGYLTAINSAAENNFIQTHTTPGSSYWIGGYQNINGPDYSEPSGGWQWLTGEPFSYTNWNSGEPNNAGQEENMQLLGGTGTWYDVNYNSLAESIIEFECTSPALVTSGNPSGSSFPIGTSTVTWQATDRSGNIGTCSFTVTVNKSTAPVINCPANITVNAPAGNCDALVNYPTPQIIDCTPPPTSVVGLNYLGSYGGHTYFKLGNTNTWSAANAAAMSFGGSLVSINDAGENAFLQSALSFGSFWIGGNQNHSSVSYAEPAGGWEWLDGSNFNAYTNWAAGQPDNAFGVEDNLIYNAATGTWFDNYTNNTFVQAIVEFSTGVTPMLVSGQPSGSIFSAGTHTITYTATDISGNSDTCNFTVTVNVTNATYYKDFDGDGYGNPDSVITTCSAPAGYVTNNTDCDDNNNAVYQTLNGYVDADGDGYTVGSLISVCSGATLPTGYSATSLGTDCDDSNNAAWETTNFYIDADGDGFDNGIAYNICFDGITPPAGYSYTTGGSDCDDNNPNVWESSSIYIDADGDGYTNGTAIVCHGATAPAGYRLNSLGSDCNDNNAAIHPGATEILNGIDDNCDGQIDEGMIRYVKTTASGNANGLSWANASADLQAMINASVSGGQVWVSAGTYKPTTGTDRSISFAMKNNCAIYGGFAGNETLLSQRDFHTNATILSGDIGTLNNNTDNSFHVVNNTSNGLTSTALLDGFTLRDGNANVFTGTQSYGGGMLNFQTSPTVTNCIFTANTAQGGGAVTNLTGCNAIFTNCVFASNTALFGGGAGGALDDGSSSSTLINCLFVSNNATTGNGGALNLAFSNATITNCTFYGNHASSGGVAIYNSNASTPTVKNSVFWGNTANTASQIFINGGASLTITYSDIQGGSSGTGNINADPLFVNTSDPDGADNIFGTNDDGLIPLCGSPALNTGNNTGVTALVDIAGNTRIQQTTIDMGAYETPLGVSQTWYHDADGDGYYSATQVSCISPGAGWSLTTNGADCNDNNNAVYQTLNGYVDADGDGYTVGSLVAVCSGATLPTGYSATSLGTDCDDNNNAAWETTNFYIDADGDGFDNGIAYNICYDGITPPTGYSYTTGGSDCNDNDPTLWESSAIYIDNDGDGYTNGTAVVCHGATAPAGYSFTSLGSDCNDNNPNIHPGATEICGNNIDENCDGQFEISCNIIIQVKAFIEGFYLGNSQQNAAIEPNLFPNISDTVILQLAEQTYPFSIIASDTSIIYTDGTAIFNFNNSLINNSFYLVFNHRNSITTWSANPVFISSGNNSYDFSSALNKAYGNNLKNLGDGNFAIWSGDISDTNLGVGHKDGIIESTDYSDMENAVNIILVGYVSEDITGDGVVESLDYSIMENNVNSIIFSIHP